MSFFSSQFSLSLHSTLGEIMSEWVLLLGGSTGHGAATAKKLAKDGYGIIAFHFDRGEAKKIAEETINEVTDLTSGRCHYFNTNAASEDAMKTYIPKIKSRPPLENEMFEFLKCLKNHVTPLTSTSLSLDIQNILKKLN